MKIKTFKHSLPNNRNLALILNGQYSYNNHDYHSYCYYLNQRDYFINGQYKINLLPEKIINLKDIKNFWLKYVYVIQEIINGEKVNIENIKVDIQEHYNKLNDKPYFKNYLFHLNNGLLKDYQDLTNDLNGIINLKPLLNENQQNKFNSEMNKINNKNLKIVYQEKEKNRYNNFILAIRQTIKFLEKRINFYQKEYRQQNDFKPPVINVYDLSIIEKNLNIVIEKQIIENGEAFYYPVSYSKEMPFKTPYNSTDNINKVVYYLIRKETGISRSIKPRISRLSKSGKAKAKKTETKNQYLNESLIYDNIYFSRETLINDFCINSLNENLKPYLEQDLKRFSSWFLTKTI
jgi:hypothetical protein